MHVDQTPQGLDNISQIPFSGRVPVSNVTLAKDAESLKRLHVNTANKKNCNSRRNKIRI